MVYCLLAHDRDVSKHNIKLIETADYYIVIVRLLGRVEGIRALHVGGVKYPQLPYSLVKCDTG